MTVGTDWAPESPPENGNLEISTFYFRKNLVQNRPDIDAGLIDPQGWLSYNRCSRPERLLPDLCFPRPNEVRASGRDLPLRRTRVVRGQYTFPTEQNSKELHHPHESHFCTRPGRRPRYLHLRRRTGCAGRRSCCCSRCRRSPGCERQGCRHRFRAGCRCH